MKQTPEATAANGPAPSLDRAVSFPWLVLLGLGTTIGAGIYALTGVVAGRAGLLAPSAFVVASLLAAFTALSFGELSSRYPRAGGEAVYVFEATGSRRLMLAVGLLAAFAGVVSAATIVVAFTGYFRSFVELPVPLLIGLVVLALAAVAGRGIRETMVVAGLMTLVEIGGLLAVIGFGASALAEGALPLAATLPAGIADWRAVGGAALLCFYAFLGFEDMVSVAEEVRDVRRTLPLAILVTLGTTTLLYVGVAAIAVAVVPPEELARSEAPLALVFARSGGSATALGGVAMLALLNGALIQVLKASRVIYGLGREAGLPAVFGTVNLQTRTPLFSTLIVTAGVAGLGLGFRIGPLAETTAAITLVIFALVNGSLILVKRRGPAPSGAATVPAWVPWTGLLVSVAFVAGEAVGIARKLLPAC